GRGRGRPAESAPGARQGVAELAHHRELDGLDLADLARVEVEVDDPRGGGEGVGAAGDAVVEAGADGGDQIRLLEGEGRPAGATRGRSPSPSRWRRPAVAPPRRTPAAPPSRWPRSRHRPRRGPGAGPL